LSQKIAAKNYCEKIIAKKLLRKVCRQKNAMLARNYIYVEPILRLLNLQLQRQRCSRQQRFFKIEEDILFAKQTRLGMCSWG
jgi:hypothetical protein